MSVRAIRDTIVAPGVPGTEGKTHLQPVYSDVPIFVCVYRFETLRSISELSRPLTKQIGPKPDDKFRLRDRMSRVK